MLYFLTELYYYLVICKYDVMVIIIHIPNIREGIMAFGSIIFNELKLSNSCYMAAAIQFSNTVWDVDYAMFHIFSGPLFANL